MGTRLEAGLYYIGDPCYLIVHSDEGMKAWGEFCDEFNNKENNTSQALVKLPWGTFWVANTYDGDGAYPLVDREGKALKHLPVDAGLISVIPIQKLDLTKSFWTWDTIDQFPKEPKEPTYFAGGCVVIMRDSFVCDEHEGTIHIKGGSQDYRVLTNRYDEYEEDDDDE